MANIAVSLLVSRPVRREAKPATEPHRLIPLYGQSDAHIVATLFKVHKQAKSTHKISSLYVIDAIAREARQQAKKAAKGKGSSSNTPLQDGADTVANDDSDDFSFEKRKAAKGTYASFLSKVESFLDRLVAEVLTKGPPEHKVISQVFWPIGMAFMRIGANLNALSPAVPLLGSVAFPLCHSLRDSIIDL